MGILISSVSVPCLVVVAGATSMLGLCGDSADRHSIKEIFFQS